ncbi:MAG: mechanosensitive ion channel family protein [Oceanospirillaceae bacterium]|nr:mechanosensitive ion channel family protein [Oceanospirillaceae bacterium]
MRKRCFGSDIGRPTRPLTLLVALLCLSWLTLIPSPAIAAEASSPPSDAAQEAIVQRTQTLLDSGNASVEQLNEQRAEVARLRDAATARVQGGSVEARVMQAQLDSLGPPPAEGETEAEDIAARRAELENALAQANEPVRKARETLQRAELLIREIDGQIRRQEARQLLKRFPSPLVPTHWTEAGTEVLLYVARVHGELEANLENESKRAHLRSVYPQVLLLAAVGLLVLIIVQPRAVNRLEDAASRAEGRPRRWFFSIMLNLLRFLLPALGALMLVEIVPLLDITPALLNRTAALLPLLALIIVMAHWLGHTLFSPKEPANRLLPFDDGLAHRGVRLCQWLGVVLALDMTLKAQALDYSFQQATLSVVSLPVIFIASTMLWRFAFLLRKGNDEAPPETGMSADTEELEDHKPEQSFLRFIAMLMRISAIVSPIVVLLGYVNLSRQMAMPLILTIAELGIALFLYRLLMIVLDTLVGRDSSSNESSMSLLPIIVIFFLSLAMLPVVALTWGARPTDIAEVWRLLTSGVQLGDINLSLDSIIMLVLVFTSGLLITRWVQRLLRTSVLPRTRLDTGARNALVTGLGYLGMTLAALVAVSSAGLNLASLAVVAGALSVGIGFGLQTIVSNFVSGIILLIERPIKQGDWIEVSGYAGYVRKISVRSTRIETFDSHDVIVPNSDLIAGVVKNMTLSSKMGRLILPVGVAYGSDLEKTRDILLEAARSHNGIRAYPAPQLLFIGLGDSSLDFELRCFLKDVSDIMAVKSDLLFSIYAALNNAGVEIPFPQRDLHLRDIDRLVAAIEKRASNEVPTARRETPLDA